MEMPEPVQLLQKLINTPSFSREETATANIIEEFLKGKKVDAHRKCNNVWAFNKHFNKNLPTILLNSHHDTIKPSEKYSRDPFKASIENGKLYGLGSNDAGGALVALLFTFLHYYDQDNLPFNLAIAVTAEEEISGKNGVESILAELGDMSFGLIGEPTNMQMAIAEKGLMVLDCEVEGKSGHAARNEGENAIYKAIPIIDWFKNYRFPERSELLGEVKMTVTKIEAGDQHNVVPDLCRFVVDVRTNEKYSNQQILDFINTKVSCKVNARSLRLNSSSIPINHPIVKKGQLMGLTYFGSPTLSDQALMHFPTLKIGPGDSGRSHTADEFIYLHEIEEGIEIYIRLLKGLSPSI